MSKLSSLTNIVSVNLWLTDKQKAWWDNLPSRKRNAKLRELIDFVIAQIEL